MKILFKVVLIVLVVWILSIIFLFLIGGFQMRLIKPWLNSENADQVVKVEHTNQSYGVAPDEPKACYYSTDKEIIAQYLDWYGDAKLIPTIRHLFAYNGGGAHRVTFTFADGSTKEIYVRHGYYVGDLCCFDVIADSELQITGQMNSFYRFNVTKNNYSIYTCGDTPELVREHEKGASKLYFEPYEGEVDPSLEPTHYIDAQFGKVYFLTDTLCYIESHYRSNGGGRVYYTLYGQTLTDLIQ